MTTIKLKSLNIDVSIFGSKKRVVSKDHTTCVLTGLTIRAASRNTKMADPAPIARVAATTCVATLTTKRAATTTVGAPASSARAVSAIKIVVLADLRNHLRCLDGFCFYRTGEERRSEEGNKGEDSVLHFGEKRDRLKEGGVVGVLLLMRMTRAPMDKGSFSRFLYFFSNFTFFELAHGIGRLRRCL